MTWKQAVAALGPLILICVAFGFCVGVMWQKGRLELPPEPRLAHMKVEGGTIYRLEGGSSLVFVPDPPRKP